MMGGAISEGEASADAAGDERVGEACGEGLDCSPASAVGGDDDVGCQLGEGSADRGDERLEDRAAEVESADHRASLWPMRVARVIAVLELGGAQLGALRLSLALRAHGIESRWLAGHATRKGLALFRAHGVDVEVLGGGPALQYARRRKTLERLAVALLDEDLVHAHMFGGWWAAARAVPDGLPLAASEHNALQWPGRVPARALHEALARVDLFFAHGPAAREEILAAGFPLERIREGASPICCSMRSRGWRSRRPRSCSGLE